jgi:hypothetical protein
MAPLMIAANSIMPGVNSPLITIANGPAGSRVHVAEFR